MFRLELVRTRNLSPSVRELTFRGVPAFNFPPETDESDDSLFTPGQWLNLFAKISTGKVVQSDEVGRADTQLIKRSYSVASAPRADGTFDLAVTHVVGGPMSELLHRITPADLPAIEATNPMGFFVLDPVVRPVVFVATGTGIAPFRSMWSANKTDIWSKHPVTLLFGGRAECDLLYRDELERLARDLPTFTYIPTLSQAQTPHLRTGRVQVHLPDILGKTGPDVDVYICGVTKMVSDVKALVRAFGVPRKQVHTERYD